MAADEGGADECGPDVQSRAGMLSRQLRTHIATEFARVCDTRTGVGPVPRGQGEMLSVARLRAGLQRAGEAGAVQDQICRSMDPDEDGYITHVEYLNGLLNNVLAQPHAVIIAMAPQAPAGASMETFFDSMKGGVQNGVIKICQSIVANILAMPN
jgi:hypothetical protein